MKWLNLSSIDWPLTISVGVLLAFSLISLFLIDPAVFKSQFIFLFLCIFVFLIFSQIDSSVFRLYSTPIYVISLLLLAIVLFLGSENKGSIRWLEFFGISVQFSEILKPFLALAFANYLSNLNNFSFKSFVNSLIFLFPIVFLIFKQPDLGNTMIYIIVAMGALIIYGFPFKWFFTGFLAWLSSLPLFWIILHDYQRQRILTFINPTRDPLGTSYNAIQAVIAVGSGMILGRGLGQGTQAGLNFLPERHTDFIFSTISEETGFIGSIVVIMAFAFLLFRIFIIIKNNEDKFSKIFSVIVFLIIFTHFFINVGMNIGLVPIVGVTLPFVSYGGSSLLANFILLGLLFSVNRAKKRDVLEIG